MGNQKERTWSLIQILGMSYDEAIVYVKPKRYELHIEIHNEEKKEVPASTGGRLFVMIKNNKIYGYRK